METDSTPMNHPKWSSKLALRINVYPKHPVFQEGILAVLHKVINQNLEKWSTKLKVAEHADARSMAFVGRDDKLSQVIPKAARLRQGLGSAVLKGSYRGLVLSLVSCEETLPPEINYISVAIGQRRTIEKTSPPDRARTFFESLVAVLPIRYGNAYLADEREGKNLLRDQEGVRAVGVKLDASLPGLYWLNYFGAPYVRLIGEERLLSSPAYEVKKVGDGVLISLAPSPLNWRDAFYKEREERIINHLGSELFFIKGQPGRRLIAPNFREG